MTGQGEKGVSTAALTVRNISKSFGAFKAVDGVDLDIATGEIHAMIGPNGAGKTTCFNLLTGDLPLTNGEIQLHGKVISGLATDVIARQGLVRSYQISSIFPDFTVLNNVRFALQQKRASNFDFWRPERSLNTLNDRAMELLENLDLDPWADHRAGELPYGRKRALEIATTLALDPSVLLLDEPTSGMGREDIGRVTDLIRKVAVGRTVLMVEHNLSVVQGLCDKVTVLARGQVIAQGTYDEVANDARVVEAYLGAVHA
ncbi:Lipopolysaccharide export system ATP-binding protein LptB [Marinovum algicola]|uniref:Amino acid/amide ABC transporter ATP-binding protein 1, HAAT family n=1 Tax=Marinovum algicola TaxID=42444 RepID=A0A975WBV7_9RHOB|nr:ABC transporter ATP-binding protein [Marinovum algicola]SEJ82940.1 amino acid/amide ABC transporter ATP-binding protein 1, HAAT family [Marinovum algicola]SLN62668.1 Lipopolysaccharide export system ATP-binding protein LptB [Marinovum algicola]